MIDSKENRSFDDNEINEIVGYLSYELVLENLKNQINLKEGYGNINYLEIFNEKYNYITMNYSDNPEIMNQSNQKRKEIYNTALQEIQDMFKFKLTFKDILIEEELFKVIDVLYSFFVLNIRDNLIKFYSEYIRKESKNIIKSFKNNTNYKDLYFSLLKKKLNKENSILIFSIGKVVDTIQFSFIEDFIDMIIKKDEDEYDNFIINKLFNTEDFIDDVTCEIDEFISLIKFIIKDEPLIVQSVKAELYQELIGKED